MPMIDLTMIEGALDDDAKATLVEGLTAALIELEGAPDNEYVRAITWCFVDERPRVAINVAGAAASEPIYRIELTVPEGAPGVHGPLMEPRRTELVRRATELVLAAEGTEFSATEARRVWVQIKTIPDGHWGGFGELVRMTDIGAYAMGAEPGSKAERLRAAYEAGRSPAPA